MFKLCHVLIIITVQRRLSISNGGDHQAGEEENQNRCPHFRYIGCNECSSMNCMVFI